MSEVNDGHKLHMFDEGEDDLSWEIIHPDTCREAEVEIDTIDGHTISYLGHPDCPFEYEVDNIGAEVFDKLPEEGTYDLTWWVTQYQATPWDGPEYESGIQVGDKQ